jgi:hypothetical protein
MFRRFLNGVGVAGERDGHASQWDHKRLIGFFRRTTVRQGSLETDIQYFLRRGLKGRLWISSLNIGDISFVTTEGIWSMK